MLSLPGWHREGALAALTVGSPFLVVVPRREITAPESAGVLNAGPWKPGCSMVEAQCSHGASKQGLEEGGGGRVAAASCAWGDLSVAQEGDCCGVESFCPIMEFTVFLT